MFAVRYVLPTLLVAGGFLCLLVAPESTRLEGWAGFTGAGLGRQWNLPEGLATPESEAAAERARKASPDRPRS